MYFRYGGVLIPEPISIRLMTVLGIWVGAGLFVSGFRELIPDTLTPGVMMASGIVVIAFVLNDRIMRRLFGG